MSSHTHSDRHRFDHLALFYEGEEEFVDRTLPFVCAGLAAGEPVMVATSADKCERLAGAIGAGAEQVEFRDMAEIGRNPACILPVWQSFAEQNAGRPSRGVGEPIWPGRSAAELSECHHHEALLNEVLGEGVELTIVCPYDKSRLAPEVVDRARRTHPAIIEDGAVVSSTSYLPPGAAPGPFEGGLSRPPKGAITTTFSEPDVPGLRAVAAAWIARTGLEGIRSEDLLLSIHELAVNSVRHGGGSGTLSLWAEDGLVVGEVRDGGRIEDPLTGRRLPPPTSPDGRGLWIVNHLCDLVQIRSGAEGTTVRVHMALTPVLA